MNKRQLFLYTTLGIIVGECMPTNVLYGALDLDDKQQKTLLFVYSQQKDKSAIYSEVSQIVPKKDFRLRYSKIVKTEAFRDGYSGKSLGDFIKVEY